MVGVGAVAVVTCSDERPCRTLERLNLLELVENSGEACTLQGPGQQPSILWTAWQKMWQPRQACATASGVQN